MRAMLITLFALVLGLLLWTLSGTGYGSLLGAGDALTSHNLFFTGRACYAVAASLKPDEPLAYERLAFLDEEQNDFAEAGERWESLGKRFGQVRYVAFALDAYYKAKEYRSALRMNDLLITNDEAERPAHLYNQACLLALLGERNAALGYLETAAQLGWNNAAKARADPDLASLRDDPRFQEWLAALKPPAQSTKLPAPERPPVGGGTIIVL